MGRSGRKINPAVADFLSKKPGHVHFVGISGIGMAGLAFLLKSLDFKVSGCDLVPGRMAKWLKDRGIRFYPEHNQAHISRDVEWVIRTAAVSSDSPEIMRAKKLGIPVFARGTVLPELIAGFKSVAIGGTHGKTTTTTFITQMLMSAGRMPSWCIGGESGSLGGVAGFRGKASMPPASRTPAEDVIVVEADESDGTLARYRPDIAVVTNIEFDHMEHFNSVRDFENCFRTFISNARQKAVFCIEDPRARALCGKLRKCLSYGFRRNADVRGTDLKARLDGTVFSVVHRGKKLGRIDLPVPGIHNVLNALAATAVGLEMGLGFAQIRRGLSRVSLPRRRFDRVAQNNGITVISDYAHHPSEIAALIRTARKLKHSRLIAVFQPHRYTRTLALGADFPGAFEGVDELILVPVYAASEKPMKGGTIWDLYENFRLQVADCRSQISGLHVSVATSLEQAWAYFRTELKRGDLFLVIGAGDVEQIAEWAREEVPAGMCVPDFKRMLNHPAAETRIRFNEPMAKRTTLRVGGNADALLDAGSEKDIVTVVKWAGKNNVPLKLIGGGSNVLVSDLGIRGITVRLSGSVFGRIRRENGVVVAGAGVPIARLLNWLEERGLGRLEFLEGIPGTVGGALRMNAGAWGDETWKHVSWIRCLNMDGSTCKVRRHAVRCSYRDCPYLRERILIEAGFDAVPAGPASMSERRDIRQKRQWLKGLHSAGSVFKNPKGNLAGQLIERAGMKGAGIGGASVSRAHANVIVTETGACASDVMALVEKIRGEVASRFGVHLETEVEFLE